MPAPFIPLHPSPPAHMTPRMLETVRAGFPSTAAPYTTDGLDFNRYLVSNPAATFALYAAGDSMSDAGISDGDLLVVDRARQALSGDIVVARIGTAFTVKRLRVQKGLPALYAENAAHAYPVLQPTPGEEWELVGVVTFIVKKACPRSR